MMTSVAKEAARFGLKPLKKLGQNFIFDSSLCDRIARESGVKEGSHIVEVGPGPAGLTRSIISVLKPNKLTVIETDQRCLPLLQNLKENFPKLNIMHEDAMRVGASSLAKDGQKIDIIANLPYNIGTKLLTNWLSLDLGAINSMTLMLQKEVVERIVARTSTKEYGRLSVLAQNLAHVNKLFDVSPQAFTPPPKVWSSIVSIKPKLNIPEPIVIRAISEISRIFFSNRRKKIRSSVKRIYTLEPELLASKVGLNLEERPEDMPPKKYLDIALYLLGRSEG